MTPGRRSNGQKSVLTLPRPLAGLDQSGKAFQEEHFKNNDAEIDMMMSHPIMDGKSHNNGTPLTMEY